MAGGGGHARTEVGARGGKSGGGTVEARGVGVGKGGGVRRGVKGRGGSSVEDRGVGNTGQRLSSS